MAKKPQTLFYSGNLGHYVTTEHGYPEEVRIDFDTAKRVLRRLNFEERRTFDAEIASRSRRKITKK
jgi:hypothetical protein